MVCIPERHPARGLEPGVQHDGVQVSHNGAAPAWIRCCQGKPCGMCCLAAEAAALSMISSQHAAAICHATLLLYKAESATHRATCRFEAGPHLLDGSVIPACCALRPYIFLFLGFCVLSSKNIIIYCRMRHPEGNMQLLQQAQMHFTVPPAQAGLAGTDQTRCVVMSH